MQSSSSAQKRVTKRHSVSLWPEVLIAQHTQLETEIRLVTALLFQNECRLLQVDARLKKIIKGVLLHLELESCFFSHAKNSPNFPSKQHKSLSKGFLALETACHETMEFLHSIKLASGSRTIKNEHVSQIHTLLQRISALLGDEDDIYSTLKVAV